MGSLTTSPKKDAGSPIFIGLRNYPSPKKKETYVDDVRRISKKKAIMKHEPMVFVATDLKKVRIFCGFRSFSTKLVPRGFLFFSGQVPVLTEEGPQG